MNFDFLGGPFFDHYQSKKKIYVITVLCFAYSWYFVSLPMDNITDRLNYLAYAEYADEYIVRNYDRGLIYFLFNEPLWLLVNKYIGKVFTPEDTVKIIIAFSSFVCAFAALKNTKHGYLFVILILLIEQVAKNYIVHLRQGFAIAIFLLGWMNSNKNVKIAAFILLPFIHTSFFITLIVGFLLRLITLNKFGNFFRNYILLFFNLVLVSNLISIGNFFSARQAYNEVQFNISGLGFFYWFAFLCLVILEGPKYLKQHNFVVTNVILIISCYWISPLSIRVFENTVFLVFLSGCSLTAYRRIMFSFFLLLNLFMSYGLELLQ